MAQRLLPDEIHNYAHNNEWLVRNLSYVGRVREAVDLAKNMVELPQLAPRSEIIGRKGGSKQERSSFFLGSRSLVKVLVEFELWETLVELERTGFLASREEPLEEVIRLSGLVSAYAALNRVQEAQERMGRLGENFERLRAERYAAADEAERGARKAGKSDDERNKAVRAVLDITALQERNLLHHQQT
ncbi:MAG: hypothetical protein EBZ48_16820 [Proteobacteria bacterium]|nr:hypothetical protein [Pseudomonadota bacterium]